MSKALKKIEPARNAVMSEDEYAGLIGKIEAKADPTELNRLVSEALIDASNLIFSTGTTNRLEKLCNIFFVPFAKPSASASEKGLWRDFSKALAVIFGKPNDKGTIIKFSRYKNENQPEMLRVKAPGWEKLENPFTYDAENDVTRWRHQDEFKTWRQYAPDPETVKANNKAARERREREELFDNFAPLQRYIKRMTDLNVKYPAVLDDIIAYVDERADEIAKAEQAAENAAKLAASNVGRTLRPIFNPDAKREMEKAASE